MMTRIALFSTLALSACASSDFIPISTPGTSAVAAIPTTSRASELTRGMTMSQVGAIIGMPIASYDDPRQVGHVCFSHLYGSRSAPSYVHTEFLGGNMEAATDGHADQCGPANFP